MYKFLYHLPKVPEDIVKLVDLNKQLLDERPAQCLKNWFGKDMNSLLNVGIPFKIFERWVKTNITDQILDARVNYIIYDRTDGLSATSGVHTDGVRDYTILYNLTSGGADATTCFWHEQGQEQKRPRVTQGRDLTKLNYITGIKIPERTWCIINSRILHSVEFMTSSRIALQISLDEIQGEHFFNQEFDMKVAKP